MDLYAQWEDHCKNHMTQCWKCHLSFTDQTDYLHHPAICKGYALESAASPGFDSTHVPRATTLEDMLFEKRKRENNEPDLSAGKKPKLQQDDLSYASRQLTETLSKGNKLKDGVNLTKNDQAADHVKWLPTVSRASSQSTPSIQEDDPTDILNATPTPKIPSITILDCEAQTAVRFDSKQADELLPTKKATLSKYFSTDVSERLEYTLQTKEGTATQTSALLMTPVAKKLEDHSQSEPKVRTSRLMASVNRLQATVGKAPRSNFSTNPITPSRDRSVVKANDSPEMLGLEQKSRNQECPQTEETSFSSETTLTSSEIITAKEFEATSAVPSSENKSICMLNVLDDSTVKGDCEIVSKLETVIHNITDALDSVEDGQTLDINHNTVIGSEKLTPSIATTVQTMVDQHLTTSSSQSDNIQSPPNPSGRKKITPQMILEMKAHIEELESNHKMLLKDHALRKCQEQIMKLEAILASKNVIIVDNQIKIRALEKEHFNRVVKQATETAHQILSRGQSLEPKPSREASIPALSAQTHQTHDVLEEMPVDTLDPKASGSLGWFKKLKNEHFLKH